MSKHEEELHLTAPELDNLESEIKTWVKEFGDGIKAAINAEIKGLKDVVQVYMRSNDIEHRSLRDDIEHFRGNDKQLFDKVSDLKEETERKVTAVRLDLQNKLDLKSAELHLRIDNTNIVVDEVKAAPGKKAQDLLGTIGKYIITSIITLAITAIVYYLATGAGK